jgi:hypothetical protein
MLWPKIGDSLFLQCEDTWNRACLDFARNPWDLYARGYLEAADHLANRVLESERGLIFDKKINPLVGASGFIVRDCLGESLSATYLPFLTIP